MSQFDSQGDTAPSDAQTDFFERSPSQMWEQMSFADCPHNYIWVWFKPENISQGLVVRIPDETWENYPNLEHLTIRMLLQTAGVDPRCVSMVQLYGVAYDETNGTTPLLEQAVPRPAAGMDANIVICVNVPNDNSNQQVMPRAAKDVECISEVFERIDADWNTTLEIQNELANLRNTLADTSNRLKGLNRDLTSEERLHASNKDKQDWLDAKRWLRDTDMRLCSCIKEFDIGDTSSAGSRKWFEQVHKQFIVPRHEFDGIQQAQRSYELYRKMVVTLHSKMNTAHLNALNNGERRAQQVLNQIAAKIRDAHTKRTFLGVMLD